MQQDAPKFPYTEHENRLKRYDHNDRLFSGEHFDAFAMKINSPLYQQQYAKLKYVAVNFAGLISRVAADMLFGEGIESKVDNPELQQWLRNLSFENKLETQLYESAMVNSRLGDSIFKVRSAQTRGSSVSTVIIEEVRPSIYFPKINSTNWRAEPEYQDLAFIVTINGKKYLRTERHYIGYIMNLLNELDGGGKIGKAVDIKLYNPELKPVEETGINRSLLIHVPNWRAGDYWGISDYSDLETLMYALNNRLTKNENVLDKHTDPILALPEGVLDRDGNIDRSKLDVFTIPDNEVGGSPARPEYITWNASLENSFKQIDKLMEFLFLTSETSPGVFGMDKEGQAESGRALKLKLMRTIAKINRKKRYYDQGIREALLVSQELAHVHGFEVMGQRIPTPPELPTIKWSDGLPIDDIEQVELETARLDAGIQSKEDAIVNIDHVSAEEAQEKLEKIDKETTVPVPLPSRTSVGTGGDPVEDETKED